ncbi:hypothetical protein OUY22_35170 [Nonomuraea sp. MCN248]|uniref:Teneurin-like YD-shell domain-containing protein n=1 Tax=Nonomuraea corallina TaxID=2989783 RepID=A0ABT4SNN1_9ACTN|nr:RHS repeat-associated core domain-containing protein [Nonomuraea corallina]MDA0638680.1 hypothetical protein [Nonomuraea corallina]
MTNEITDVTHTAQIRYTYDPDGNKLSETVADRTGGDPDRTTTYTYDAHGNGETSTGPEGGVARSTWNNLGLVDTITDEMGSIFGHTYTKRGELATRTLKNWTGSPVNPKPATEIVLESRSYDAGGRLAATTDAMGRKTSYTYFNDNRLSQVIADDVKLNGSTTPRDVILEANTYDAAGNLTRKVTGGGVTRADYEYDAAGRLASTTLDPSSLNRRTVFEYDANDNTTKETRTGAGSTRQEIISYAYNAAGVKTRQTVENGNQDLITTWTVDDRGLVTAVTDPRGNTDGATAADFTVDNRYDALGRLIEAKAPAVQIEKAGTEAASARPIVRSGYDTSGNQTHQVDAEGRTVTTAYDKDGRVVTVKSPAYTPPGGTALTPQITHQYDPAGRLTKTTDPRGHDTTFEYDALGNLVRTTDPGPSGPGGVSVAEYNLVGEQMAAVDPTGARIQATYDDLGRKITETEIERRPTNAAFTTTYTYNDAGILTKAVAPGNKTTSFVVNAAGEVTSTTDPANNTTTNTYDLAGRLLQVRDATLNATATSYDLAGRPIEVKDLNSSGTTLRTVGLGYDPAGNVISETSAEQHTIRHAYDALNRLTSLTEPVKANEEIVTRFGYDASGARTRLIDGRGNTTWTAYNSLGLVERVIEPATTQHPSEADRTWTYGYDQAGNNTTILQPGGVRIDRTYDHLGRLTQESGAGGGAATAERTFGYDPADRLTTAGDYTLEYNDRGLLTKMASPSGQPITMAYDANGNLTQRVDAAGTANFTWDNANRAATATDPVTGRTWTYGYDKANRVTSLTSANPVNTHSISYDNMGRATSQTLKSGSGSELAKITYGWDLDDNLTTKTTSGLAGSGMNTYGYDHANRLTSWTAPNGTTTAYEWDAAGNKMFTYDERNRLTSGDGTDYTYTPRGTLASESKNGVTTQLTFDAFDRLIADRENLYSYDAFDRVTRRISGTTSQIFAYAGPGNDLAAISVNGSVQAKYARDSFGALLGLQEDANPAVAAFNDLHGDLVGTFTGTALVSSTAYDPFGEISAETGQKASLGYQSEYTDPDTGKVNMHARWYQPGTGTFTSRDTATLDPSPSVQSNRYTYANASPVNNADWKGNAAERLCSIILQAKNGSCGRLNANADEQPSRGRASSWAHAAGGQVSKGPDHPVYREREFEGSDLADSTTNEGLACHAKYGAGWCVGAWRVSKKVAVFAYDMLPDGRDEQKRSAIRHFIWQVMLTVQWGPGFAEDAAANHEKYSKQDSPGDTKADLAINAMARQYGVKHKKKLQKMISNYGFDQVMQHLYGIAEKNLCDKDYGDGGFSCENEPANKPGAFGSMPILTEKDLKQAEIDLACMTGPCTGSTGGWASNFFYYSFAIGLDFGYPAPSGAAPSGGQIVGATFQRGVRLDVAAEIHFARLENGSYEVVGAVASFGW